MKSLKIAGLLVPALLAVNASAMVRLAAPISPRINPYAGLPMTLPSPLTGPLSGRGVTLPSPVLDPKLVTLALPADAPRVALEAAPLAAAEALPSVGMDASRENVSLPALLPESVLRLGAAADGKKVPASAPDADELRGLFDGSRKRSDMGWEPILPRERAPQSRRHGLPEDDLERELGLDGNF